MCASKPRISSRSRGLARVVATVQVQVREPVPSLTVGLAVTVLGQRPDHVDDPGQGGFEQRGVVLVGAGGDQVQGDSLSFGGYRALGALLAPVNRAAPGDVGSAG